MCSFVLLSSCTLTQQQIQIPVETTAEEAQAADELEAALLQEEITIQKEAKEAAEAAAKAEAEAEARRQEEEAKAAIEKEAEQEYTPQLLTTRKTTEVADTDNTEQEKDENISPTPEQQEAALALLQEQETNKEAPAAEKPVHEAPVQDDMSLPDNGFIGGLRTRRFAPPEEASSRDTDDEPMPNRVELRGFRSPTLKGRLPMNIDGKIIKED